MTSVLEQRLFSMRHVLVDRLLGGLLFIALVGVPASLSRLPVTGWIPLYAVHIAIGLMVLALFFFRRRLSWQLKAGLIVCLFWGVGLGGLISLGILGAGAWWLVVSALLISVVASNRAAGFLMALILLVLIFTAKGFISGQLSLPFDANEYIRAPTAWLTMGVGLVMLPLLVFLAVGSQSNTVLQLVREIESQRAEIEKLASHDELTGVPRLKLAMDRLDQAIRHIPREGRLLAVFFIDLDGFKAVNDTYGHAAGDIVLTTVAQRFRQTLRTDDTLARKGGDEFIAILQGLASADEALKLATKLVNVISQPLATEFGSLQVGASIGVALSPLHSTHASELVARADEAMYAAKKAGKNQAKLAAASSG